MCFLYRGISMSQSGAWFAQPEAQLTEYPLALANPDGNAVSLLNPGTECFSIPEVPAQTNLPRRIAQNLIHRRPLFFRQASGSPRSLPLRQSCQTVSFKTTDPIFHRPWCIAQKMCHLRAGHTLGYQKHPMETMIVARFLRAANLILQSENDRGRVRNGKWFHYSMKSQSPCYTQLLMSSCLAITSLGFTGWWLKANSQALTAAFIDPLLGTS
jgi:hypothetical protein